MNTRVGSGIIVVRQPCRCCRAYLCTAMQQRLTISASKRNGFPTVVPATSELTISGLHTAIQSLLLHWSCCTAAAFTIFSLLPKMQLHLCPSHLGLYNTQLAGALLGIEGVWGRGGEGEGEPDSCVCVYTPSSCCLCRVGRGYALRHRLCTPSACRSDLCMHHGAFKVGACS